MKKHIPNILSSVRFLSPAVLTPLIVSGNYLMAIIALSLFLGTDAIDGFLARKWHVESELGAKIDVVADKVILASLLIPLILMNPLFIVSSVMEIIISTTNVIRKMNGYNPKTLQIGRIKMVLISVLMGISYLGIVVTIPNVIYNILFSVTVMLQGLTEYSYLQELFLENKQKKIEKKFIEISKHRENNDDSNIKNKDVNRKEELLKMREELLKGMNEEKGCKKKIKKL